jgi:hypothetical protein
MSENLTNAYFCLTYKNYLVIVTNLLLSSLENPRLIIKVVKLSDDFCTLLIYKTNTFLMKMKTDHSKLLIIIVFLKNKHLFMFSGTIIADLKNNIIF